MKARFTVILVFVACLGFAKARADDGTSQKSLLQGVWILSHGETNGNVLDEVLQKKGLDGLRVEFTGDLMNISGLGASEHIYRFTLKPADRPQAIRLVTVETQGKAPTGSVLNGIYKIEENQLKLCLPADSTVERPKKFEAPSGSRHSMLVLKRHTNDKEPSAEPDDARESPN